MQPNFNQAIIVLGEVYLKLRLAEDVVDRLQTENEQLKADNEQFKAQIAEMQEAFDKLDTTTPPKRSRKGAK